MNPSAHVNNVAALADFRAGLVTFIDQARDALTTLDMEIRRTVDWLDEQAAHWKAEIRAAENAVFQAKSELTRKRMMKIGDRRPDTTEQEEVLDRAQQRLDHALERYGAARHWLVALPEEIREYQGPSRILQESLERELPRMIHLLEQKIASLEAYAQMNAPRP